MAIFYRGRSVSGSEEELAKRLRSRDIEALAELFALHRHRLWHMVHFRLDPRLAGRVDADDILQEAYLAASQRFGNADLDQLSPFVWLRLIVQQTLIDVHRQHLGVQMRDAGREVPLVWNPMAGTTSVSLAAHFLANLTSPSRAAVRAEIANRLEEVLSSMDPMDQEVLALRHFEELTNNEVAEVLGIQVKAASIRYVRALKRLKEILQQIPGFGEEGS